MQDRNCTSTQPHDPHDWHGVDQLGHFFASCTGIPAKPPRPPVGQLVIRLEDDSDTPLVGEVMDVTEVGTNEETLHVAWGDADRAAGITQPVFADELVSWRAGAEARARFGHASQPDTTCACCPAPATTHVLINGERTPVCVRHYSHYETPAHAEAESPAERFAEDTGAGTVERETSAWERATYPRPGL